MKKTLKFLFVKLPLWSIVISVLACLVIKWVPIRHTPLMIKRMIEYRGDDSFQSIQIWTPFEKISDHAIRTIIAAEDARFFNHHGFEEEEISIEFNRFLAGEKDIRGCSTISQQTAKNVFTFGSHTWLRKGIEAWFTFLIERIWGKKRILEVYLNVAEFGKGIYGIEAAAQYYFNCPASQLQKSDASSLALCLPSPLTRTPEMVNKHYARRRAGIARRAHNIDLPTID